MKEIPQHLIDECEKLSSENEMTYFIFDKNETNTINLELRPNKETERDVKIDDLIGEDFHIGTIDDFNDMPSRLTVYDTETKLVGRYDRYKFVVDLFTNLGFEPSINNFGPEFEQTFSLSVERNGEYGEFWLIRLQPNLFLSIKYSRYDESEASNLEVFNGFFNRNKIFESLLNSSKSLTHKIRDMKLSWLIKEKEEI
jgi:hypothetical protein